MGVEQRWRKGGAAATVGRRRQGGREDGVDGGAQRAAQRGKLRCEATGGRSDVRHAGQAHHMLDKIIIAPPLISFNLPFMFFLFIVFAFVINYLIIRLINMVGLPSKL